MFVTATNEIGRKTRQSGEYRWNIKKKTKRKKPTRNEKDKYIQRVRTSEQERIKATVKCVSGKKSAAGVIVMKRMRFPIAWENAIKQKKKTPKSLHTASRYETNRKLIAKTLSIRALFRKWKAKRTRIVEWTHNHEQIDENYYTNLGR